MHTKQRGSFLNAGKVGMRQRNAAVRRLSSRLTYMIFKNPQTLKLELKRQLEERSCWSFPRRLPRCTMGTSVPQPAPWKGLRPQSGSGVSRLQPCLDAALSPPTPCPDTAPPAAPLASQQAVNPPSQVSSFPMASVDFEQLSILRQERRRGRFGPGNNRPLCCCERWFLSNGSCSKWPVIRIC